MYYNNDFGDNAYNVIREVQPTPEPKKQGNGKKHVKGVAMLLAVAMVGTASGFGGSLLYDSINGGDVAVQKQAADTGYELLSSTDGTDGQLSVSGIAQKAQPSVVEITTEVVTGGQLFQSYVSTGAGSGVIISEDGYIITNHHVIDGATSITVKTINGEEYTAELVGSDAETDLAVLKINANGLYAAEIGSSAQLAIGDYVMAIGNPLGELGGTVSDGIVSALSREITIEGETMTLLQTNAAINPGNSGGGLFNEDGELVAIVNAKSTGTEIEGIGFAIPIDIAVEVVEDIIDVGYVQGRFSLGVGLIEIGDETTAMMYRVDDLGVYIQNVTEGGNAHLAGIQVGDRIVEFNGKTITTNDELLQEIENATAGQTVEVVVDRNNERILISVVLHETVSDSVQALSS